MTVTLAGGSLSGAVAAIPSKSDVHRLLICAALADGPTQIRCAGTSGDIAATVRCLRALGAEIRQTADGFTVAPIRTPAEAPLLDCGESGSTLRFLLPVACALGANAAFTGAGRLPERPLSPLYEELQRHGCTLSPQGRFPLTAAGRLLPGAFTLDAGVSSQFVSGLLFALPLLPGESTLALTGRVESGPYIDLTVAALTRFGAALHKTETGWRIPGGRRLHTPGTVAAEGDWSNAAFWLCAGALGGGVTVTGLAADSLQGDRRITELLTRFGADVSVTEDRVTVRPAPLRGVRLDAADIPDLVPVLAAVAAAAEGETVITGAARLRLKESDRLRTTAGTLRALGADVRETADGLRIRGTPALAGGVTVSGCGDHRIVMTAAVAAIRCRRPATVTGAEAVDKSYPGFFRDYAALGGAVCTQNASEKEGSACPQSVETV